MTGLITHDWIAQSGGSERVLFELSSLYPSAKVRVLWADASGPLPAELLTESWMAHTPLRRSKVTALPFMLPTWRHVRLQTNVDWVLASSHLFAHHARVQTSADAPKLVYAHSPARYIWAPDDDRRGAGLAARAASTVLKPIDRRRAKEPLSIAANSQFTRERIQRAWHRDSTVIYPPVDVALYQSIPSWADQLSAADGAILGELPDRFLLGASRFVAYKRLDVAIATAAAADLPVVIAGHGPDEARLRALAADVSVPVHFLIRPSDGLLRALYERATAYVFAAIEDFGIMPVEAMALGTPVIASGVGGAAESVIDGISGAFFVDESPPSLAAAVTRATACDRHTVRNHALRFDRARFRSAISEWMFAHTGATSAPDTGTSVR